MTILKVSLYIVIYLLNKSVRVGKCCVLREDIKSPQSATTPRVLTLKRSLACFEGIQRESPSYADARSGLVDTLVIHANMKRGLA